MLLAFPEEAARTDPRSCTLGMYRSRLLSSRPGLAGPRSAGFVSSPGLVPALSSACTYIHTALTGRAVNLCRVATAIVTAKGQSRMYPCRARCHKCKERGGAGRECGGEDEGEEAQGAAQETET
jgi:hypothetical protein